MGGLLLFSPCGKREFGREELLSLMLADLQSIGSLGIMLFRAFEHLTQKTGSLEHLSACDTIFEAALTKTTVTTVDNDSLSLILQPCSDHEAERSSAWRLGRRLDEEFSRVRLGVDAGAMCAPSHVWS